MKIDVASLFKNLALVGIMLLAGYNHLQVKALVDNQSPCHCAAPAPAPAPPAPVLPPVATAAQAHLASFAAPWHAVYVGATSVPPTITTKAQLYQVLGAGAAPLNAEINKVVTAASDASGNITNPAALADFEATYKALGGK